MSTKRIARGVLVLSVMLAGIALFGAGETEEKTEKASNVVVGTFDSRAVKLACGRAIIEGRIDAVPEMADATATPEQIRQRTIERRKIEFRQGFGTGDVSEYLDLVRDEIPKIAQEAGVDVIVSKWDIEYHSPVVVFVDVTEVLIQPFNPTEETLEIIKEVRAVPPLSEKEIREREKRDGVE